MIQEMYALVVFSLFVILFLVLDLGVFHKKPRAIKMKEALLWSFFWIALSFLFAYGLFLWQGKEYALLFVTSYLVEKSLSIDNIFVFVLIFSYFKVNPTIQHRILFWGVVGALIMRAIFIAIGITLLSFFHWILYPLALLLIYLGFKIMFRKTEQLYPEKNILLNWAKRYFALSPFLIVLIVVEMTDLIFAIDSIPAVLAITLDPFIVYTSNVLAILGLRALYFCLAGVMSLFCYLHIGLGLILIFVGVKIFFPIPIAYSLLTIVTILAASIVASLCVGKNQA